MESLDMEAIWGAVLSLLFVLATLSGYGVTGPSMNKEQMEKIEKEQKEQQEKMEKEQKEQQEKMEKAQKEKSDHKEKSRKKEKSEQNEKNAAAAALKNKSAFCIKNCPDELRLH
jgi:uncharacterized membrane protein YhiD involved in acid resistance